MTTRQAAAALGIRKPHLLSLIRDQRMDPPAKDAHGFYLWDQSDLDRARAVLAVDRRRKAAVCA